MNKAILERQRTPEANKGSITGVRPYTDARGYALVKFVWEEGKKYGDELGVKEGKEK